MVSLRAVARAAVRCPSWASWRVSIAERPPGRSCAFWRAKLKSQPMSKNAHKASYLKREYPRGRIRTALGVHKCNGVPEEGDPGCGKSILRFDTFYDTGRRDKFKRAGRFCNHCAMIGRITDLFDIAEEGQSND